MTTKANDNVVHESDDDNPPDYETDNVDLDDKNIFGDTGMNVIETDKDDHDDASTNVIETNYLEICPDLENKDACDAGMTVIETDDLEICPAFENAIDDENSISALTICSQDFSGVMKSLKDSPKDNYQMMVNTLQQDRDHVQTVQCIHLKTKKKSLMTTHLVLKSIPTMKMNQMNQVILIVSQLI